MKLALLTLILTTLSTLALSLPTTESLSSAQAKLVCHSGLPASVCAAEYDASCSENGGFYGHPAQDGRS
ncbi:hypothetical protein IFR04_015482, partial [Cadophora malorum]